MRDHRGQPTLSTPAARKPGFELAEVQAFMVIIGAAAQRRIEDPVCLRKVSKLWDRGDPSSRTSTVWTLYVCSSRQSKVLRCLSWQSRASGLKDGVSWHRPRLGGPHAMGGLQRDQDPAA